MNRVRRNVVIWVLVVTMVASPAWVYAQQAAAAGTPPAAELDLSYVTPSAVLSVVAHPRRVLTSPEMEMLPIEVITAAGKKELGLDPLDIEQVMAVVEPPVAGPPGYGVVVRFARPYRLDELKLPPDLPLADAQLEGLPYRQAQDPMTPGFFMPDDRTLLIGPDAVLKKMLANQKNPVEGPLSRLMAKTDATSDAMLVAVMEPVRPLLSGLLVQAPVPPPFEGVKRLPELIDAAKLDLGAAGMPEITLVLLAPDDSAAEQLQELLNQLLDTGQQMAVAQITSEMKGDDPVQEAAGQYAQRMARRMIELLRPKRSGRMLRVAPESGANTQVATVGILVALLLPAVQAAREAARRAQSTNNLKQIAIAMHNHHDVHRSFPARASFDADGKPLLSWRVHILPFVGQQALYEQFHLDEPWDSEHNKQFIEQMPPVYRNPSSIAPAGKADYAVPVGAGSIFAGQEGTPIAKIKDGASNTLLALEVNPDAAVIWSRPDDFEFDTADPLVGLGKAHPGGFNAAMADGSVRFISIEIDPQMFLNLLNMADGQVVDAF